MIPLLSNIVNSFPDGVDYDKKRINIKSSGDSSKSIYIERVNGNVTLEENKNNKKNISKKNSIDMIVSSVSNLCISPASRKNDYYKIMSINKKKVRVKILGLVNGEAEFKREEMGFYEKYT